MVDATDVVGSAPPPDPVRKVYWVIDRGTYGGRSYRPGMSVTLSTAEAHEYRVAGVGLSFVRPDPR